MTDLFISREWSTPIGQEFDDDEVSTHEFKISCAPDIGTLLTITENKTSEDIISEISITRKHLFAMIKILNEACGETKE